LRAFRPSKTREVYAFMVEKTPFYINCLNHVRRIVRVMRMIIAQKRFKQNAEKG